MAVRHRIGREPEGKKERNVGAEGGERIKEEGRGERSVRGEKEHAAGRRGEVWEREKGGEREGYGVVG